METTGSIVIVLLGTGATGAMVGRAAAYAFAAGFGLVLVARTIGRSIRPRRGGHGHARRILGYGSALVIVDGAFTIFSQIDVILIGAILSVSAVGLFEAAYRLAGLLYFIGLPIRSAVAPRLARGGGGPDHVALERTLRYVVLAQGVILAPLIVWAEPLTRIAFGTDYLESAEVLRALAPFALLAAISPLLAGAANYLGAARRRVPIALVTLAVNAAIDLALLEPIGIVAAAIGTDVAYVIYVGAHLHLCRDLAGLRLRPLVAPLAGVDVGGPGHGPRAARLRDRRRPGDPARRDRRGARHRGLRGGAARHGPGHPRRADGGLAAAHAAGFSMIAARPWPTPMQRVASP